MCREQTVFRTYVVTTALKFAGEIALARRELCQGVAEVNAALLPGFSDFLGEHIHHDRSEHVHSEEAEVVARSQSGNNQTLLSFRRCGFLDNFSNLEQAMASGNKSSAHAAIEWQHAFVRGLNSGDAAIFCNGDFNELLGAAFLGSTEIQVIADKKEERSFPNELAGAVHSVAVAQRCRLFDERDAPGVAAGGSAKCRLIARTYDDADFIHSGLEDFLDDDLQGGLGGTVAIDEALEREGSLSLAGGSDDGFLDFHGEPLLKTPGKSQIEFDSSMRPLLEKRRGCSCQRLGSG